MYHVSIVCTDMRGLMLPDPVTKNECKDVSVELHNSNSAAASFAHSEYCTVYINLRTPQ